MIDRDCLLNVLRRYQDTQPGGIKHVDEQIELFRHDCIFISFPVISVVGSVEPRLMHGRGALYDAFQSYNDYMRQQDSVSITYVDAYADVQNDGLAGICGFTLIIHVLSGAKRSMALNQAQFHVGADGLIRRMMNWQAMSTAQIQDAVRR